MMVLSETFLNSEVQTNDPKLNIDAYFLQRWDHPGDYAHVGICVH